MHKYDDRLDLLFHSLGNPSRRAIVERLSRGPATVSELARPLPMSMPAVHQHLQILESSGIVRSQKVGRVRTCRLEPSVLGTAEFWLRDRRTRWERRLDRLTTYPDQLPPEEPSSPVAPDQATTKKGTTR